MGANRPQLGAADSWAAPPDLGQATKSSHLFSLNPLAEFVRAVRSTFGSLSGYTHPSKRQFEERIRRVEVGQFIGFETTATLRAFNRVLFATYDLVLALIFEGIGPAFTGDLFEQLFVEDTLWKFHKGRYVRRVSRSFDHKGHRHAAS